MSDRDQNRIRKRLLSILSRAALMKVSGMKEPHQADKATLLIYALKNWDKDKVAKEIGYLLHRTSS